MHASLNQTASQNETPLRKPLRVWPGVALAIVQVGAWFGLPVILPEEGYAGFLTALLAGALILVWWLFFSRAAWRERLGFLLLMSLAIVATSRVIHFSVAGTGRGLFFYFFAGMLVAFVFVLAVALSRSWADRPRRAAMAAGILLTCSLFTLVRNEGVSSEGTQFKWRWSATPEELLLAQGGNKPLPPPVNPAPAPPPAADEKAAPATHEKPEAKSPNAEPVEPSAPAALPAEWPGFRGPQRDGVIRSLRIDANWSAAPPRELWRRAVGPGWSSFAVRGDMLYTQEQRGDDEVVSCYNLKTGQPVWEHRDPVRFWEANAGAGPRGTPELHGNRLYAFGAKGLLNALDADTGARIWTRDVAKDADKKVPYWGFSSSPLVVGDIVVVAASGKLAAYDLATGNPRWFGPSKSGSYSSAHLATVDGVTQILLPTGDGTISVSPADGKLLWEHAWAEGGATMLQPARAENGDFLLTTNTEGGGAGIRRVAIEHLADAWKVKEVWTSRGLKPQFNDFVVHKGHAYGFDGSILSCISLADGERKWKGGRYGQGQLVLLPEQDLLLVISEEGELALVSATADGFKELARIPALDGKTWNHPVLVGDILLVRNDREMAAFKLSSPNAANPR